MKTLNLSLSILFVSMMFITSCSSIPNNLQRFKEDNAMLSSPKSNEDRIVFMGNSITEGWGNLRPEFFAGKPYVNRGISGETTPQMLMRFRQDVVRLEPAAVVILAGINDIAGNTGPTTIEAITENIISMVELANKNDIKVVLCAVLPANKFPWRPEVIPTEKVVQLNALLKNYAESNAIPYVDYYTPMVDDAGGLPLALAADGVHPNVTGYLIMEPLLEGALAKVLSR